MPTADSRAWRPGPVEAVPLHEDSPLRSVLFAERALAPAPDHWIAEYDKILVERVVSSEPQLPTTVLRLPKVFGPGDGGHFAMLATLVTVHPDWRWTHGYVENVAQAIALAATDSRAAGRTYNVGEEHTPCIADRLRGRDVASAPGPVPPLLQRFDYAQDIVYDTGRIRRELGYVERVSFDEAMSQTLTP